MNGDTETVDPKVDFSDTKNLVSKKSSRKTKIAVVGALAVALLLGAVVSLSLFLSLKKTSSTPVRLTEVNLEEGETLTYRVDQKLEVSEGKVLTGMFNSLFNFSKSYDCFKWILSSSRLAGFPSVRCAFPIYSSHCILVPAFLLPRKHHATRLFFALVLAPLVSKNHQSWT